MGINIHTSHRVIFLLPATIYLILVFVCAVWPAMQQQVIDAKVPKPPTDELIERGRHLYRSFNCVTCHTQQIRGDPRVRREVDGEEDEAYVPVLAADTRFGREIATQSWEYAHQEPPLLGTQRTGPDLTSVGKRLPESQWHYWHLYNPQSVSPGSLMPPHRFLFTTTQPDPEAEGTYEVVHRIEGLGVTGTELWATPDAVALVEYLLSLTREGLELVTGE
jgi:cytochrome c oxidase cbb3-type subunit 2